MRRVCCLMKPYQLGASLSVLLSVTVMLAIAAPMCFLQKTNKKFIYSGHIVFWGCLLRIKHILYLGSVTCECHVTSLSRTYFHALLAVLWIGIRSDPEIFWPGWILIRENHSRSEIETDLFDIQIFFILFILNFTVVKFFFDYVHTGIPLGP